MTNWANRTIWAGDNLPIMRGMNSESVDLIYLDPPFNSKANYAAPIGSKAAGAEFKDTWSLSDVDAEWVNLISDKHPALNRVILAAMTDSDKSYLVYMAPRILEMKRILKPTGSIYLHCDPTMSHYLKLVMDAVFRRENFRNELIWHYGQRTSFHPRHFSRKHDVLLFYAKTRHSLVNKVPLKWDMHDFLRHRHDVKYDENGDAFIWTDGGARGKRYKRMVADVIAKGKPPDSVWDVPLLNSSAKERTGYPTQKPLAVLERIVQASSNPGDVVLDPFCGCATACVASEKLVREWAGIDISPKAQELVDMRMRDELGLFGQCIRRTDIPKRSDLGDLPHPRTHRNTLYGLQEGNCAGCGEHFELRHMEVDHIIAKAKGGTDHIENLQLLCSSCNRIKGDRGMEYLRLKLQLR